jgi:hypothetical protein
LNHTMKAFYSVLALVGASASALPIADKPSGSYGPAPGPNPRDNRPSRAAPAPYAPPPAPYKPAAPYKEKELPPQPYQFEYGVNDQYSGAAFQAAESQSDKGEVYGEYKVNLPDGRVQTVSYRADPVQGFVADVKYEGEAVFPPEPEEGYGANKYVAGPPKYKPAPPPVYRPAPSS